MIFMSIAYEINIARDFQPCSVTHEFKKYLLASFSLINIS